MAEEDEGMKREEILQLPNHLPDSKDQVFLSFCY
jgi:hypothetical protein